VKFLAVGGVIAALTLFDRDVRRRAPGAAAVAALILLSLRARLAPRCEVRLLKSIDAAVPIGVQVSGFSASVSM
jgi:hypothetical protein